MNTTLNLFEVEYIKLKHQRFPVFSIIFVALFTVTVGLFRNHLSSLGTIGMGSATGWQIFAFAASWSIQIAALLVLIISINLISEEFSDKTIKNLLTRQLTRSQFLLGKLLTMGFVVLIFLFIIYLSGFITGMLLGKMGHVFERGYMIVSWQKQLWNLIVAFIFSFITVSVVGIFGMFVAVLIPKSGVAIGASVCLYFVLNIASQFDAIKHFLFTSFTTFPIDTAKEIVHGLATSWTPDMYWCLTTNFVTGFVLIFASLKIFNRKDILS